MLVQSRWAKAAIMAGALSLTFARHGPVERPDIPLKGGPSDAPQPVGDYSRHSTLDYSLYGSDAVLRRRNSLRIVASPFRNDPDCPDPDLERGLRGRHMLASVDQKPASPFIGRFRRPHIGS